MWEFVPLTEYCCPTAVGASAARLKWGAFKRFFTRFDKKNLAPLRDDTELQTLSQVRLDRLVPAISWDSATRALDAALNSWLATLPPEKPVKFVVGPPHSGLAELLTRWRVDHKANHIDAPDIEHILDAHDDWLTEWPAGERLWVLPQLEHCYLRHTQGLSVIRRFFEMALGGELGHGLIGCDSWAWAYLQHIWPITQSETLTLQAFDGSHLGHLFFQLASTTTEQKQTQFKNTRTGKTVLLPPSQDHNEVSPELTQLAVYCRGNAGLARLHWRDRLRAEPEQALEEKERNDPAKVTINSEQSTIWVSDIPNQPILPNEKEEDIAFILHTLLLHNGLPATLLPELVPLPHHRIMALLLNLQSSNIVTLQHDRWNVTAFGYLSVRDYLHARDFLVDDF